VWVNPSFEHFQSVLPELWFLPFSFTLAHLGIKCLVYLRVLNHLGQVLGDIRIVALRCCRRESLSKPRETALQSVLAHRLPHIRSFPVRKPANIVLASSEPECAAEHLIETSITHKGGTCRD
jgi:hypothetical protein